MVEFEYASLKPHLAQIMHNKKAPKIKPQIRYFYIPLVAIPDIEQVQI